MSVVSPHPSSGTVASVQPKVLHVHRRQAPRKAPCPHCGQLGSRKQVLPTRTVRDLAYQAIVCVHVTTAE